MRSLMAFRAFMPTVSGNGCLIISTNEYSVAYSFSCYNYFLSVVL